MHSADKNVKSLYKLSAIDAALSAAEDDSSSSLYHPWFISSVELFARRRSRAAAVDAGMNVDVGLLTRLRLPYRGCVSIWL